MNTKMVVFFFVLQGFSLRKTKNAAFSCDVLRMFAPCFKEGGGGGGTGYLPAVAASPNLMSNIFLEILRNALTRS